MSTEIILFTTFAAGVLAVLGSYSLLGDLFLREREQVCARLNEAFRDQIKQQVRSAPTFQQRRNRGSAENAANEGRGIASGYRDRLQTLIDQAGLSISAGRLLLISGALSVTAAGGAYALWQNGWAVAAAAPIGVVTPLAMVAWKRKKRIDRLCSQLPDAFEVMSRAVRAGQTMTGAFQVVADDFESPLAEEFAYCYEQQNLGMAPETALRDMARRTGVMELQMFVVIMLVLRTCGGNPVELLNNLAQVVRQRTKLRGKVKALTSEGRMQAWVLMALPPLALLAITQLNREYAQVLLNRPQWLMGLAAGQLLGALWIRRIVNFDY